MKLRIRNNSLRIRLNRNEVAELAQGKLLKESVAFPGGSTFSYRLSTAADGLTTATFLNGTLDLAVPQHNVRDWSDSDEIGLYYKLDAASPLDIAIEKDLECLDAPDEERDPFAYPRKAAC
jgi:hypothetical protein